MIEAIKLILEVFAAVILVLLYPFNLFMFVALMLPISGIVWLVQIALPLVWQWLASLWPF